LLAAGKAARANEIGKSPSEVRTVPGAVYRESPSVRRRRSLFYPGSSHPGPEAFGNIFPRAKVSLERVFKRFNIW
jgi:hypothetical protein